MQWIKNLSGFNLTYDQVLTVRFNLAQCMVNITCWMTAVSKYLNRIKGGKTEAADGSNIVSAVKASIYCSTSIYTKASLLSGCTKPIAIDRLKS